MSFTTQKMTLLFEHFRRQNWNISTAESCTGGLIAGVITSTPGSSTIFKGSIVAYSNDMKTTLLHVHERLIETYGAVSSEVAAEMAKNMRSIANTSISISTTGIAGPGGGSNIKPIGTVFIGISTPSTTTTKKHLFSGDRNSIRDQTVTHALEMLAETSHFSNF